MNEYTKQGNDFLKEHNVKMIVKYLKHDFYFLNDKETRDIFKITFKRNKKQFSLTFGQSLNNKGINPSSYDVLSCLQKYDVGSFDNFISDFGYNEWNLSTYPKVLKIYKTVVKQYNQIRLFFTGQEIEKLQDIN